MLYVGMVVCRMLVKRAICRWIVSFLFVYVTRLTRLVSLANMASSADDVYYKLLDEVKYVAFDSLRTRKTWPNLAGDCRNLIWNTCSSLSYTVAAALCQNNKIWSSLNFWWRRRKDIEMLAAFQVQFQKTWRSWSGKNSQEPADYQKTERKFLFRNFSQSFSSLMYNSDVLWPVFSVIHFSPIVNEKLHLGCRKHSNVCEPLSSKILTGPDFDTAHWAQPPLIIQIDLRTSTEIFIVNVSSDLERFVLLDKLQEGTAEANVIAGKIIKR